MENEDWGPDSVSRPSEATIEQSLSNVKHKYQTRQRVLTGAGAAVVIALIAGAFALNQTSSDKTNRSAASTTSVSVVERSDATVVSNSGQLVIVNPESGTATEVKVLNKGHVWTSSLASDGKTLTIVASDSPQAEDGDVIQAKFDGNEISDAKVKLHLDHVGGKLAISRDGNKLAYESGSYDDGGMATSISLNVRNLETGDEASIPVDLENEFVHPLAFNADGSEVIVVRYAADDESGQSPKYGTIAADLKDVDFTDMPEIQIPSLPIDSLNANSYQTDEMVSLASGDLLMTPAGSDGGEFYIVRTSETGEVKETLYHFNPTATDPMGPELQRMCGLSGDEETIFICSSSNETSSTVQATTNRVGLVTDGNKIDKWIDVRTAN